MKAKKPFRLTERQELLLYMVRLEALVSSQQQDLELFVEFSRRVTRGSPTEDIQNAIRTRLQDMKELHSPKHSNEARQAIMQAVSQAPHGHKARMAATFGVDGQRIAIWKKQEQKHYTSKALETLRENYTSNVSQEETLAVQDLAARLANAAARNQSLAVTPSEAPKATGIPHPFSSPSISTEEPILGSGLPRYKLDE